MTKHKKVYHISDDNRLTIEQYLEYRLNKKPIHRPRNLISSVRKLADFLKDKKLQDATIDDLMYFFNPKNNYVTIKTRNYHYQIIKQFYQYIDNIPRKKIPERLDWYEPITDKEKTRYGDADKKAKHLITREDYQKIMKQSNDANGQDKALWEIMLLSGARPEETAKLKIKSIIIDKNRNITIDIKEGTSKTTPRKIPLPPQKTTNIYRWKGNHPYKHEPETNLWTDKKTGNPITIYPKDPAGFIRRRFNQIKAKDKTIKQTLMPKSFRKNKATTLFKLENDKNSNIDIEDVAKIMGWTIETAQQRRKEYHLTDWDDLKDKIFTSQSLPLDYDGQSLEIERIQQQYKELKKIKDYGDDLKSITKKIDGLEKTIKALSSNINPYYMETPPYYYGQPHWIQTKTGKMQLLYIDTKTGYMKEYLEKPITIKEYEKNAYLYNGQLAKYLYKNKLTKKIEFKNEEQATLK
jgi:site-specific recombinase XerC